MWATRRLPHHRRALARHGQRQDRRIGRGDDHVQHRRRHAQLPGHRSTSSPRPTISSCPGRPVHAALARLVSSSIVVRAPATSANLGAGFDCLGLALDLWNEVTRQPGALARRRRANLILRAARAVYDLVGAEYPGFELRVHQPHPVQTRPGQQRRRHRVRRAVRQSLPWRPPRRRQPCSTWPCALEGHPDNVVPCLLGGAAGRAQPATTVASFSRRVPLGLRSAAPSCFIPDLDVPDADARGLLPAIVQSCRRALQRLARQSDGRRAGVRSSRPAGRGHARPPAPAVSAAAVPGWRYASGCRHAGWSPGRLHVGRGPDRSWRCATADAAVDAVGRRLYVNCCVRMASRAASCAWTSPIEERMSSPDLARPARPEVRRLVAGDRRTHPRRRASRRRAPRPRVARSSSWSRPWATPPTS